MVSTPVSGNWLRSRSRPKIPHSSAQSDPVACCGVGAPLEAATVRLMMALKLLSLGRGASGVRWRFAH